MTRIITLLFVAICSFACNCEQESSLNQGKINTPIYEPICIGYDVYVFNEHRNDAGGFSKDLASFIKNHPEREFISMTSQNGGGNTYSYIVVFRIKTSK